jgi:DNA-binding beta-propeller fold protein YncE
VSGDYPGEGARVAGYRLEEQIGSGGMAVVFRARDERLGRPVALKILSPLVTADQAFRHRFIRESRAAAAVDDPHIIPVYEAGEDNGVLFIAMRYVPGGDVGALLRVNGSMSPDRAMEIVSPVASALDAAHAAGLVHRDVKPANMLIDRRDGRPDHLYLSDFGLSKASLSLSGLTGVGQILGTVDYCAPEQLEGRAVDGRADQYALACAALELLTGQPPFPRGELTAVILSQVKDPPPTLTSRRPDLPAAADAVFARALAKAPDDRYASCREFADALRESFGLASYYSAPHSIPPIARPPTKIARIAAGQIPDAIVRATDGKPEAVIQAPISFAEGTRAAASPPAMSAEPRAAASEPGAVDKDAVTGMEEDPVTGAGETSTPAGATTVRSAADLASVNHEGQTDQIQVARRPRRPRPRLVAVSGIGVLAVAGAIVAAIVAIHPGHQPGRPPAHSHQTYVQPSAPGLAGTLTATGTGSPTTYTVAYSPDGKTLAAGSVDNGRIYLWNVATRKLTATLTDPGKPGVYNVAFSPDGKTLAVGDGDGSIYLWDVATGHMTATLTDPGSLGVYNVAFSPNGTMLAAADGDGSTCLWDVITGRETATLTNPHAGKGLVTFGAFSPDGATLAVGGANGKIYLWNMAARKLTATLTDPRTGKYGVGYVAFSPDGVTLAVGDTNDSTYLWDVATLQLTGTLTNPLATSGYAVNGVAFSPDGNMLAVGDSDGNVYLWDVASRRQATTLTGPHTGKYGISAVAFSPDGKTVAASDSNNKVSLWNVG